MLCAPTVDKETMLPELLRTLPWVRPVLDRYGLRGCGGPEGPQESVGFFASAHDVDADRLLGEIRAELEKPRPVAADPGDLIANRLRSEEHTSELQSQF